MEVKEIKSILLIVMVKRGMEMMRKIKLMSALLCGIMAKTILHYPKIKTC